MITPTLPCTDHDNYNPCSQLLESTAIHALTNTDLTCLHIFVWFAVATDDDQESYVFEIVVGLVILIGISVVIICWCRAIKRRREEKAGEKSDKKAGKKPSKKRGHVPRAELFSVV